MNLSKESFQKAHDFILANGRMIERRLFDFYFNKGSKEAVMHAVLAYQNKDGGFGHGMEPDTASPESQPLFTLMALETLDEVGALDHSVVQKVLPYLESVTAEGGGIPWMLKPTKHYPRASHFDNVDGKPAINPTAPILGLLLKNKVEHPWMKKAEEFCWEAISKSTLAECAECILRRLVFLQQKSNEPQGQEEIEKIKKRIIAEGVLSQDRSHPYYSLFGRPSPISFAPFPNSILREIFSDQQIREDLKTIISQQQEDGRWGTEWGVSPGTRLEWDGIVTLQRLKILKANEKFS